MRIVKSTDVYIPDDFLDDRPIKHVILVCDVDGVIRDCCNADANSQIVLAIKELLESHLVDVAFISGTPVMQDPSTEIWRRGHNTLDKALGIPLEKELENGEVSIYGALGGQRMRGKNHIEVLSHYPIETVFELSKFLLGAFFYEIEQTGTKEQKEIAKNLSQETSKLLLKDSTQSPLKTPKEFAEVVLTIRKEIDPRFRLISYGSLVETLTSYPEWETTLSTKWLQKELINPNSPFATLPEQQKQIAMGVGYSENFGFNFLMVCKISKSLTIQKHIEERSTLYPDALVITIGDTQVDLPMHEHAHLAYHVGKKHVWNEHVGNLPHFMLIENLAGEDSQHTKGTLHILKLIKNGLGKPLSEWGL